MRHQHREDLPPTAVPPGPLGDAGETHVPAAPSGRDGRQSADRSERTASHTARPGPVDEPLKPVLEPGGDTPATAPGPGLLPTDERDRIEQRLHHAQAGFVDDPRRAVAEAADILDDTGDRLTESLAERRRALRASTAAEDTEELRIALRRYREVTERLLRT
ncbi:hypothetical protein [Streptomyces peucetius]|uniref:Uncharacterized protein n=1 Tax=Streptomyces peucetius TaxID=1950 RepID=A0ABY6I4T9_STRPE|nr:hypothetical protein [Streptomyces peucetius]UYQ61851.1 hypothetical protein OGH68_10325 [Streptomyces peucetius]